MRPAATFEVVRACDAIGNVPAAFDHPLIGGDVIAHEREDHHHHMLGDRDAIAIRDFGDRDAPVHCGLQINVIGADAGGDGELQLLGLGDALGGQIGGPEGL